MREGRNKEGRREYKGQEIRRKEYKTRGDRGRAYDTSSISFVSSVFVSPEFWEEIRKKYERTRTHTHTLTASRPPTN